MALRLWVLPMMLGWPLILFLADSPLFVVQVPQFTPPSVVQSTTIYNSGSSPPLLTAWFKSIATLTSIQVIGHIFTLFKSTIILSFGSSPRLFQISVQVLDLPSLIRFKSLTPISSG
ncbi:hypothetical protein R3W88_001224 [Solanum pinnatisectum]|uniref:Uncharacterized protein n=1 Tax=Solanum pinnatisectum TaxID=50273 RepID=A0AAV9MHK7_9SOLN|nr:hypothetical protein R3W88_001224 [Solanum pinnatisectum]